MTAILGLGACGSSGGSTPKQDSGGGGQLDGGQYLDTGLTFDGPVGQFDTTAPQGDGFVWPDQGRSDTTVFSDTGGGGRKDSGSSGDSYIAVDAGPPTKTHTAPFSINFETDNGGAVGTRDWQYGASVAFDPKTKPNCSSSAKPPTKAHSGTKVWGTVLNDCYNGLGNATASCKNANPKDDSLLTFRINLPSSMGSKATLRWWEWRDYFLSFDWAEVRIDGKVVKQHCSGSADPKWVETTVDVSSYIGKTIDVTFHFNATSVVNYAGWYIDDLSVTAN